MPHSERLDLNSYHRDYYSKNRERLNARAAVRSKKNRKQRLEAVAGRPMPTECEICGAPETARSKLGDIRALNFDHCHTTGAFRGWLCSRCNTAVGLLGDNPSLAISLAEYLKGFYDRPKDQQA